MSVKLVNICDRCKHEEEQQTGVQSSIKPLTVSFFRAQTSHPIGEPLSVDLCVPCTTEVVDSLLEAWGRVISQ